MTFICRLDGLLLSVLNFLRSLVHYGDILLRIECSSGQYSNLCFNTRAVFPARLSASLAELVTLHFQRLNPRIAHFAFMGASERLATYSFALFRPIRPETCRNSDIHRPPNSAHHDIDGGLQCQMKEGVIRAGHSDQGRTCQIIYSSFLPTTDQFSTPFPEHGYNHFVRSFMLLGNFLFPPLALMQPDSPTSLRLSVHTCLGSSSHTVLHDCRQPSLVSQDERKKA